MTTKMAMDDKDNKVNSDGVTGNKVEDDGDGTTGDDNDNDNDGKNDDDGDSDGAMGSSANIRNL